VADNDDSDELTWRRLDKEGCEQGRHRERRIDRLEKEVCDVKTKLDRLTWALVGCALTFGTAALMLALNLMT
jgi:hypothetical protein